MDKNKLEMVHDSKIKRKREDEDATQRYKTKDNLYKFLPTMKEAYVKCIKLDLALFQPKTKKQFFQPKSKKQVFQPKIEKEIELLDLTEDTEDADVEYDFLPTHIKQYNLPLKVSTPTPAFGDCWWEACMDQLKLNKMTHPKNALKLRRNIVKNLTKNPCFQTFFEVGFGNDLDVYNSFVKEQCKSGTFTDENGILVLATAMHLGVKVNIVAPDNNDQNPFTSYGNVDDRDAVTFWIAHYPEDSSTGQVGHFQSLQHIRIGRK